ncbi:MAG: hypothetical protein R2710_18870 [Acidimicrobiales bacterium]
MTRVLRGWWSKHGDRQLAPALDRAGATPTPRRPCSGGHRAGEVLDQELESVVEFLERHRRPGLAWSRLSVEASVSNRARYSVPAEQLVLELHQEQHRHSICSAAAVISGR